MQSGIILEVFPEFWKMVPGERLTATVNVKPVGPFKTYASLSCADSSGQGLPEGFSVNFDPPAGFAPFSSKMDISASPKTRPSTYSFLVVGTYQGGSRNKACALVMLEGEGVKCAAVEPKENSLKKVKVSVGAMEEVPIFPGSVLKNQSKKEDWRAYLYTTSEGVESVIRFYKLEMENHGWDLVNEMGGMPMGLKYLRNGTEALITISSLDLTTISIMTGPK
jgi:hypothetical protein